MRAELAVASPWTACGASADIGAAVSGKVALVGRGTCTFVEKALNAQRSGAVAMIVANYADALIRMGAYSDADVAGVTIPLVLIKAPPPLSDRGRPPRLDDTAPSPRLAPPLARAAPAQPRAPPEQRGGSAWPESLASRTAA